MGACGHCHQHTFKDADIQLCTQLPLRTLTQSTAH